MLTKRLLNTSLKKCPRGNTGLQAMELLMVLDEQFIFYEVFCDFAVNRFVGSDNAVCIEQPQVVANQSRRHTADFVQNNCAARKVPWVQSVKQGRAARAACNIDKLKCSRAQRTRTACISHDFDERSVDAIAYHPVRVGGNE